VRIHRPEFYKDIARSTPHTYVHICMCLKIIIIIYYVSACVLHIHRRVRVKMHIKCIIIIIIIDPGKARVRDKCCDYRMLERPAWQGRRISVWALYYRETEIVIARARGKRSQGDSYNTRALKRTPWRVYYVQVYHNSS